MTARLHLPVIVLGEYRFGLLNSRLRWVLAPLLERLEAEAVILPIDLGTVQPYANSGSTAPNPKAASEMTLGFAALGP